MGSAFGVICGLAAAAMLACGIRAEAKHKAQQQRARLDIEMWETEMREGRER